MIFKNKSVEQRLAVDGYCLLPPINTTAISQLLKLHEKNMPMPQEGNTYWSINITNKQIVEQISHEIINIVFPFLKLHFENIKPIISSFVIKEAVSTQSNHHQDWTFVDNEPVANSYACWIPLVDVDQQNGMMGMIKGSHNIFVGYRGSPSPQYSRLFPEVKEYFDKTEYIPMKKGEMLIFNHRTVHAALPNSTKDIRPALVVAFTAEENRLVHFYLTPGRKPLTITKYQITESFYHHYSNNELHELFEQNKSIDNFPKIDEIPFPVL